MTRHPSIAKWKKGVAALWCQFKKVVRNKYGGDYIYTHTLQQRNGNGIRTPLPSTSAHWVKYFWLFGLMVGRSLHHGWLVMIWDVGKTGTIPPQENTFCSSILLRGYL